MTTALTAQDQLKGMLVKSQSEFAKALGPTVDAEKFVRVAVTTIQNNPKLLDTDRRTLFAALHQCAQDGLMPDGREAALIPYGREAKYMPMVAGYCKRARNSGEIGTMDSQVVYECDEYEAWNDQDGVHFKHKVARGDRGKREGAYAYAQTKDGHVYFEWMAESELAAVQKMSKSQNIWNGPFGDEMWRKTVIRRLCKYRLPSSSDLTSMLRDEAEEFVAQESAPAAEPQVEPEVSSRLKAAVVKPAPVKPAKPAAAPVVDESELPI